MNKKAIFLALALLLVVPFAFAQFGGFTNPTTLEIAEGTLDDGTIANAGAIDEIMFNISETTGTPAFNFSMNMTNTSIGYGIPWNFTWAGFYDGSSAHEVDFEVWNETDWVLLFEIEESAAQTNFTNLTTAPNTWIDDSGVIQLRIEHVDPGNINHDIRTDFIGIEGNCNLTEDFTQTEDALCPVDLNTNGFTWDTNGFDLDVNGTATVGASGLIDGKSGDMSFNSLIIDLDGTYIASTGMNNMTVGTTNSGNFTSTSGTIISGSNQAVNYGMRNNNDATFDGGSGNHTFGSIRIAGNITLTSGTMYLDDALAANDAAIAFVTPDVYDDGDGTINITGAVASQQFLDTSDFVTRTFYNLIIDKSAGVVDFRVNAVHPIQVDNDLTIHDGTFDVWDGTESGNLTVTGDVVIKNTAVLDGKAGAMSFGSLTINSGGTYTATSGTTTITDETVGGYAIDHSAGTYTHNNGLLKFNNAIDNVLIDMSGTGKAYDVEVDTTSKSVRWVATGHQIDNDLTVTSGIFRANNDARTITVTGDTTIANTGTFGHNGWSAASTLGSLTINSGATYEATQGTTTITSETTYAVNCDGTYTANNGLLKITTSGNTQMDITCTGNPYNLELAMGGDTQENIFRDGLSTIDNDLNLTVGTLVLNDATSSDLVVTGDVKISGNGELDAVLSSANIELGSLTINSGGIYSATSGTTTITNENAGGFAVDCDGSYTANSGILKIDTNSQTQVDLTCTGNVYDLVASNGANELNITDAITIANTLTVESGTTRMKDDNELLTVGGNTIIESTSILGHTDMTAAMDFLDINITSSATFISTQGTLTYCHIYDSGTFTNQSSAYIQDCSPFSPSLLEPVNQLIDRLSQIFFDWTHAEWSPLYRLQVWLTGTPGSPVINITTNETYYNYTSANLTEGNYQWNVTPTGAGMENESTTASFKLDITFPAVVLYNPSEFNVSEQYFLTNQSVVLNATLNDTNLYGANATIYNSTGGQVFFDERTNIGAGTFLYNNDTGTHPSGLYNFTVCGSDDHTKKDLPKNANYKALTKGKKGYKFEIEESNPINIELVSNNKNKVKSMKVDKKQDRYSETYEFENLPKGQNTFMYRVSGSEPMVWRANSPYKAHFVTGATWVDFEFKGNEGATYVVTKIDSYTYQVQITTTKTKLEFESIGGVNTLCASTKFRVNTIPVISEQRFESANNFTNETLICTTTFADGDPGQSWNATYKFYNSSGLMLTNETACTSTTCMSELAPSLTVDMTTYTCSSLVFDTLEISSETNSTVTTTNIPPTIPAPVSPIDGADRFNNSNVSFIWNGSTDSLNTSLTYNIEIYNDSAATVLLNASYSQTALSYTVDMNDFQQGLDRSYWWRVNAYDGTDNSTWSDTENFEYWDSTSNCTFLTLSVVEPLNKKYPYSVNLQMNFTQTGGNLCWYTVNDGIENTTVTCGGTDQFDVDYDGLYNLTVYNQNTLASGICNDSASFEVDRTSDFEEGKPWFVIGVIFFFVIMGIIFAIFGHFFSDEHKWIRMGLYGFAAITIYLANGFLIVAIREYIKNPSMLSMVETFSTAVNYGIIFLAFYIFANLTAWAANKIKFRVKR
jgi:hypothetical protein